VVPGDKIRCGKPDREPGGGGINVSRALKRLGLNSTAVFTKGGVIGELYEQLVKDEGFDQIPIGIASNTRENLSVKDKKEMYRFVLPGGELKPEEWQRLLDRVSELSDAEFLVASGSLPPGVPDDFYAKLAARAKEHGLKFILDTSKEPLKNILKSGAYLIKPNAKELNQLIGRELKNEDERKKAAGDIVKNNDIEVVVVSLGADGAIVATRGGTEKLPSPSIEKEESAVGAGDSMVAGIVYSLIKGNNIHESVMYGLACGSAALTTPGTELVYKEDADKLYEELRRTQKAEG
jgi:6-phosphofructokinase 2